MATNAKPAQKPDDTGATAVADGIADCCRQIGRLADDLLAANGAQAWGELAAALHHVSEARIILARAHSVAIA